jgi:hypothetical protein
MSSIIYQHQPYTYLIGWTKLNVWYYGCRFAKSCHPNDLWKKYFTSSKHVKKFRLDHGEPDVIQVMKLFSSGEEARAWETSVLKQIGAVRSSDYLNRTDGDKKFCCEGHSEQTRKKLQGRPAHNKGKPHTEETKAKIKDLSNQYWSTPSVKENKSIAMKEYNKQAGVKEKKSIAAKEANARPDVKAKIKETNARTDVKARRSLASKERQNRPEAKAKIKETNRKRVEAGIHNFQNQPKLTCPHCLKEVDPANYAKHHGDLCKKNPELDKIKYEEAKARRSEIAKNTPKLTCPHCLLEVDPRNYARYHGDKCKKRNQSTLESFL